MKQKTVFTQYEMLFEYIKLVVDSFYYLIKTYYMNFEVVNDEKVLMKHRVVSLKGSV